MKPAGLAMARSRRPAQPRLGADVTATSRRQATHRFAGFRARASALIQSSFSCPFVSAEGGFRVRLSDETRRVGDGTVAPPGAAEARRGRDSDKSPRGDSSLRRFSCSRVSAKTRASAQLFAVSATILRDGNESLCCAGRREAFRQAHPLHLRNIAQLFRKLLPISAMKQIFLRQ